MEPAGAMGRAEAAPEDRRPLPQLRLRRHGRSAGTTLGVILAVTADLHFGLHRLGDAAALALRDRVRDLGPDVFAIAGDVGEGAHFAPCLALFADLPGARLLVPGNHDLWTRDPTPGASLRRYERDLPRLAAEQGFQCLDQTPYVAGNEAILGS